MIGEIKAEHQTATAFMLSDPKVDLTLIPAGDIAERCGFSQAKSR